MHDKTRSNGHPQASSTREREEEQPLSLNGLKDLLAEITTDMAAVSRTYKHAIDCRLKNDYVCDPVTGDSISAIRDTLPSYLRVNNSIASFTRVFLQLHKQQRSDEDKDDANDATA